MHSLFYKFAFSTTSPIRDCKLRKWLPRFVFFRWVSQLAKTHVCPAFEKRLNGYISTSKVGLHSFQLPCMTYSIKSLILDGNDKCTSQYSTWWQRYDDDLQTSSNRICDTYTLPQQIICPLIKRGISDMITQYKKIWLKPRDVLMDPADTLQLSV